jgi:hypothetical protein
MLSLNFFNISLYQGFPKMRKMGFGGEKESEIGGSDLERDHPCGGRRRGPILWTDFGEPHLGLGMGSISMLNSKMCL